MNKRRKLAVGVSTAVALVLAGFYSLHVASALKPFENALLCANNDYPGVPVPPRLCEFYIEHVHTDQGDVAALNQAGGVAWAFAPERGQNNPRLLAILVGKGVDINARDQRTGLTVLHSMVLERDAGAVNLLLESGADPDARSAQPIQLQEGEASTPLELAELLLARAPESEALKRIVEWLE